MPGQNLVDGFEQRKQVAVELYGRMNHLQQTKIIESRDGAYGIFFFQDQAHFGTYPFSAQTSEKIHGDGI